MIMMKGKDNMINILKIGTIENKRLFIMQNMQINNAGIVTNMAI